jgi:hypothetical protein
MGVGPPAGGLAPRRMLHEEDLGVTHDGCQRLTRRVAPTLPVV